VTYRLVIRGSADTSERAIDLDRDVVLVGRRPGVDVLLPHPDVAGVQLRFERLPDGSISVVEDGARRTLRDGDVVRVAGRYELVYMARSPGAPTSREGTAELARAMVRDVLGALGGDGKALDAVPHVEIEGGPRDRDRVDLPAPGRDLVVGRGETCDLVIIDELLSREHLRLHRGWAGGSVTDLGSKNGTHVNGARVVAGEKHTLRHGDRIVLGASVLVFHDPAEALVSELTREPSAPSAPSRPASRRPRAAVYAAAGAIVVAALAALVLLLLQT
jgi:hypothetical protein